MSDFQPGDVVVCVDADPHLEIGPLPPPRMAKLLRLAVGAHYTVNCVTGCPGWWGLLLAEFPDEPYFAWRFRKIRPADEQFTRQMRALRPIKTKVHA